VDSNAGNSNPPFPDQVGAQGVGAPEPYQRLFQNLLNGFAHCRMRFDELGAPVDFLYLAVNRAFETQTGLRNITGKWVSEVIPGIQELDPDLFQIFGRVVKTGVSERFEKHLLALGEWFDVSVYSPGPEEFVAIFDVVTKRKLAEQENAGLAERLKLAQEVALIGSWDWDLDADRVWWSEETYRIFNVKPGEYIPSVEANARFFHPDDLEPFGHKFQRSLATGEPLETDLRLVLSGGQERACFVRAEVAAGVGGKPHRFIGIIMDITERVRVEKALRDSEARLRSAVDVAGFGFFEMENTDQPSFFDLKAREILGLPATHEGASAAAFWEGRIHPEDLPRVLEANRKLKVERQDSQDLEYRYEHPSLGARWLRIVVRVLERHPDGRMRRSIGVAQDITQRKREEEARLLLEAQLNHLQRMESVGRLAGGVAHDMNNVLAAVMAVAGLLCNGTDEHAHRGDLIIKACMRGRDLIKSLMTFARKDIQQAQLLDLNELVRGEAELLSRTTMQKIRVILDLDPQLPWIVGSQAGLSNALMNLCVNALDAMPEGGTLTLRTERSDAQHLGLVVEDTGQGMAPEVVARAVEPFFTTKPVGKGTGLGLSVVFGTVQAHGGTLQVESRLGVGTQVRVCLPVVEGNSLPPSSSVEERPAFPPPSFRILLVDDDPLVRQSVMAMLESLRHRATEVSGGCEALDLMARELSFDAVLLDQNMPGMTGIETLRRMRELGYSLPVFMTTGYVDETLYRALAGQGRVFLLPKPYTHEELQKAFKGLEQGRLG